MDITLSYGRRGLDVSLPDANIRHVLRFRQLPTIDDPTAATVDALRAPVACAPLAEVARGKSSVCIVTSDITRPVPNRAILPALLDELSAAGIPSAAATILIGTGSHRASTPDERREMLGDEVLASGAQVVDHNAFEPDGLVHRGETSRGTPVFVNRLYADAELKIALSLVEPHLIAGFSGGRKAICPGVCGIETLFRFHAPELVLIDEACSGLIEGNPAHQESLEVARMAGAPEIMVNATLDERRRITGLFAGELGAAHMAAVARSMAQSKCAVHESVDIAVTSAAGHPLDLTFYQSVKGIQAPVPILKQGGTIIAAHECAEGIGEPELVQRITETEDFDAYVPGVREPSYFHMDQWHHQMGKVRRRVDEVLCFSDRLTADQLANCFVTPVGSVEEGVERALDRHGSDGTIAVLPEGAYVLPCLEGDPVDRQTFADG